MRALTDAGAAAVIVIAGADLPWDVVSTQFNRGSTRLDSERLPGIAGIMPARAVQRLVAAAGGDFGRLLDAQPGASFRPVALPIRVSMEVRTQVNRFTTNNVVGRLRGSGGTGENPDVPRPLGPFRLLPARRARPTGSATARSTMRAASR